MTNFVLLPAARSTPTKQAPGQLANRKPSGQRDYILLDRSASMFERWEEALGAVNTYARTLANSKVNTKVTVAVFDDQYEIIRRDVAPSVCTPITSKNVNPRGRTALNDAIGRIVLQAKTDNSEKAAIVIMTDGEENSSRELAQGHARFVGRVPVARLADHLPWHRS